MKKFIEKAIRVRADAYRRVARKHGFSDGIISLILKGLKEKLSQERIDIHAIDKTVNYLKDQTYKQILVMKQTDVNQKEFLLDVFERFGKDAQAAIDFVRHNIAEIIEDPKSDKSNSLSGEAIAVDLGLPSGTLWCDRNIGARSPEDYGAYFSWGNIVPHYSNTRGTDWGYCEDAINDGYAFDEETYQKSDGYKLKGNIDAEHDAATVNLGKDWKMPTDDDFQELYDNCTWKRKTVNGVNGYLVTSKINGNSVFFPAAGYYIGTALHNRGTHGHYWASTLHSSTSGRCLDFDSSGVDPQDGNNRFYGFSVRAVQKVA